MFSDTYIKVQEGQKILGKIQDIHSGRSKNLLLVSLVFQDTETLERKINLFPGVGGQVEDQHREEGDAHAGDDQIHL